MSLGGEADPPSFPLMKGLALANRHPWDHRPRPLSTVNEIISEDASGAATSPKLEGCVQ